jgi:hypothetical protein
VIAGMHVYEYDDKVVAAWNLYLASSLTGIPDEPLELVIWNLVWRQIIHMPTNYILNIVSKSSIKTIAMVWIFEVSCDKFPPKKKISKCKQCMFKWVFWCGLHPSNLVWNNGWSLKIYQSGRRGKCLIDTGNSEMGFSKFIFIVS